MIYTWNADTIRFIREASEFCPGYYEDIANAVSPYLKRDGRVLDAGCGLGYLSLALAGRTGSVTAADIDPEALAVLEENKTERGIRNISAVCTDVFAWLPDRPFDAAVFCYCGETETIVSHAEKLCRGPVIIIKRNYGLHRFSAGSIPNERGGFSAARNKLTELGIPFDAFTLETELGQPLKSIADARRFFELFSQDTDKSVITDAFLRERLVETGREDRPFYLPSKKDIGVLVLWPDRR